MPSKLMKEIEKYQPKNHDWGKWEAHGGMSEDNNMTYYRGDILYTRIKFKKIADKRGWKRPYRFKRREFRWEVSNLKAYELMGKLVLIDSEGNELVSDDLEWMSILHPSNWDKRVGRIYFKDKNLKDYNRLKNKNDRIWDYIWRMMERWK
jgi:hypothetical protein